MSPEALPEPIAVALGFARTLEELEVPYLVGGSLASSVHGEPRSTNDVDVLADLRPERVAPFVERVEHAYYVSQDAVREAVRSSGQFNVIHLSAALKVDVFLAGGDPFNAERLRCRERVLLMRDPPASLYVDRAEHAIVQKLLWYRMGDGVSERQWRDVLGMLRVQQEGARLDWRRLRLWAVRTGVGELLDRALAELGLPL
jgi:hypothetical protein